MGTSGWRRSVVPPIRVGGRDGQVAQPYGAQPVVQGVQERHQAAAATEVRLVERDGPEVPEEPQVRQEAQQDDQVGAARWWGDGARGMCPSPSIKPSRSRGRVGCASDRDEPLLLRLNDDSRLVFLSRCIIIF